MIDRIGPGRSEVGVAVVVGDGGRDPRCQGGRRSIESDGHLTPGEHIHLHGQRTAGHTDGHLRTGDVVTTPSMPMVGAPSTSPSG